MRISSMRSWCKFFSRPSVSPHIFTPFMAASAAEVAASRRSMACSQSAWRAMTRLVAPSEPNRDTGLSLARGLNACFYNFTY